MDTDDKATPADSSSSSDLADLDIRLLRKDVAFWIEQSDTWKNLASAERDRADRYLKRLAEAEQRIVDAPHAEWCPSIPGYDLRRPHLKCACWKSEATA